MGWLTLLPYRFTAWTLGEPTEHAFKVAAKMDLNWPQVGVVQSGFLFNLEGRLCSQPSQCLHTFSKKRHGRFQKSELFEELFEQIVRQCGEVGLVQGKHLSVDGSFVEANAAKESRIPREHLAEAARVKHTVRQYLVELEQQNPTAEPVHQQDQVSTTDPDSTYATKGGTPARLGHYDNYLVDNDS